jgi:hypothetical protein
MWSIKLGYDEIKDEIVRYKTQECERRGETNMDKSHLTKHQQYKRTQQHDETEEYTNE